MEYFNVREFAPPVQVEKCLEVQQLLMRTSQQSRRRGDLVGLSPQTKLQAINSPRTTCSNSSVKLTIPAHTQFMRNKQYYQQISNVTCTVGDVFNQHYSTLDSWFIRNLARWKTQFSYSLISLHILFYWASIQFGIQVPYCPCLAPVAGNLVYLETLQQGWGTCDPRTRCGPREHCLRPKSELSLPKSKHNIAPKQNS